MRALAFRFDVGLLLLLCAAAAPGCKKEFVQPEPQPELTGVALGQFWKKRMRLDAKDSVLVVAHRGYACCFPENTVAAIQGAYDLGSDGIEIDVRLTADGEPILMHDATVDRTTDGSGEVLKLKLSDIRALDACSWFGRTWRKCPVPTLYEALTAAAPDQWLLLELKSPFTNEGIRTVLDLIDELGMQSRASIMSFDFSIVRRARQMSEDVTIIFLAPDTTRLDTLLAMGKAMVVFHKDSVFTRPEVVQSAKRRGLPVGAYTVANENEAHRLVRAGVRILLSDFPFGRTSENEGVAPTIPTAAGTPLPQRRAGLPKQSGPTRRPRNGLRHRSGSVIPRSSSGSRQRAVDRGKFLTNQGNR